MRHISASSTDMVGSKSSGDTSLIVAQRSVKPRSSALPAGNVRASSSGVGSYGCRARSGSRALSVYDPLGVAFDTSVFEVDRWADRGGDLGLILEVEGR